MKRLTVIGFMALALIASPASANETSAIAGSVGTAVASALLCGAAALAGDDDEPADAYDRRGWMLGAGAVYGIEAFRDDVETDRLTPAPPAGVEKEYGDWENTFGMNGLFGYRCHPRFSAEGQFEWVNGFESDIHRVDTEEKVGTSDFEPIVLTTNLKGYLLTGRIQPYLLAGAGIMRAEFKQRASTGPKDRYRKSRLALRFGGGADYYLTKSVLLNMTVNYVMAPSLDTNYVAVGMGVGYRF